VSRWTGQTLTITAEPDKSAPATPIDVDDERSIAAIRGSEQIWSPESLYKEPMRPLFHFSTRRGWINDPNGLTFYAGRYHMFFQHNPFGISWGAAHWGHAVSNDLVHWHEEGTALYPRGDDDLPYSGSGIVDYANTSGWGAAGRPPMVIAFTSTGRGECIAYSLDEGRTWTEYEGNPVVKHNGRDPKLLWHAASLQWVMVVYSERTGLNAEAPKRHGIAIHTSLDLKTWQERSWIEGYYECPDLFSLPVDGDPARVQWVLTCAPGYYSIGEFDGGRFVPKISRLPAPAAGWNPKPALRDQSLSTSFYSAQTFAAAQTFSGHPDGQIVQVGWGIVPSTDGAFTNLMTFPCTLSLQTTQDGVRLCRTPISAIGTLRISTHRIQPQTLTTSSPLLSELKGEAWDIHTIINVGSVNSPVLFTIGGDEFTYRPASQMLTSAQGGMQIPLQNGRLRLRMLVDRTTIEIFGDRGQAYGLFVRQNPGAEASLALRTIFNEVYVEKLIVHALKSAWE
jgi:fructan beta-fructosidase